MKTLFFLISVVAIFTPILGSPKFYSGKIIERFEYKKSAINCGYEACPEPKSGVLNIHLVPHTHDDVGWLKTVDQYYYGNRNNIQLAGVQYIIDSVITELIKDPTRRFIYVETAYLWKWLKEQNDHKKHLVKNLIAKGQLEIIGGAWSMNDEAAAHYHSIIDQFTWGLRRLNDSFGSCARPKIGWQIDPFGHSREMASLFAQMGFDGLFLGRIDYQDKDNRKNHSTMEMVWEASANLGDAASLFTGTLYNNYAAPPGFCFDVLCSDDPIIDDINSYDYNIEKRVESFIAFATQQSKYFKTNHIIFTMGGDFTYQAAHINFKNMDKLIRYVNDNYENVTTFYSTPSCYLKALHDSNITWPTKSDDFFPYASDPHAYWTGYFTSRPTQKYFERKGNNLLQVTKQIAAVTDFDPVNSADKEKGLIALREAVGIMQHHDAITGTEKQHVAYDYARILYSAMSESAEIASNSINKVLTAKSKDNPSPKLNLEQCSNLNISECFVSEYSNQFVVVLYNPSSRNSTQYARIPVVEASYSVYDAESGIAVASQIIPISNAVLKIPNRVSLAIHDLIFAAELPPIGYKTYYIKREISPTSATRSQVHKTHAPRKFKNFDVVDLQQEFIYYCGTIGNNEEYANRSSGAYIFRPNGSASVVAQKSVQTVSGPLVTQHYFEYNSWINLVVREYEGLNHIEFDWVVGPIPINDNCGKEVVLRYNTNLNSKQVFYTDSNGREMLRRVLNHRDTWNVTLAEPVAGNYYPVTSRISIEDVTSGTRFAVLTDRSEGGSSLQQGSIELMIHRRLLHDDAFGVGEALNETDINKDGLVVRGTHYLITGNKKDGIIALEKEIAQNALLAPWYFFADTSSLSLDDFANLYQTQFSSLRNPKTFPANLQILTLEPWKHGLILFRLEHIFEKDEHPELSKPACINIQYLFSTFDVLAMNETMLGGNQWKSDNVRLQWKKQQTDFDFSNQQCVRDEACQKPFDVSLNPMEIRTFILTVKQAS